MIRLAETVDELNFFQELEGGEIITERAFKVMTAFVDDCGFISFLPGDEPGNYLFAMMLHKDTPKSRAIEFCQECLECIFGEYNAVELHGYTESDNTLGLNLTAQIECGGRIVKYPDRDDMIGILYTREAFNLTAEKREANKKERKRKERYGDRVFGS